MNKFYMEAISQLIVKFNVVKNNSLVKIGYNGSFTTRKLCLASINEISITISNKDELF